jgi:acetyltransferase-like isoleucine patch superfamily enzyme
MNIKSAIKKLCAYVILKCKGRESYARFLGVVIGENCRIITTKWGTEPFLISIGNNVTITDGVRFLTHDGSAWLARDNKGRRYLYAPIVVGNNVFIGVGSIILPGVEIEDNVIVAAGSVVTKSIRSGSVVGGVPAQILGKFDDIYKKMLNTYTSEADINNSLPYKERVLSVVKNDFKPFL